ncbi:serine carboxypeptidase-like 50 [Corylus avellana]|uniref:serine carboxypeptidase-like 50 n=1 Tax=Corylus avellana TaxID=13451 RepID=UPI001E21B504|nr:serine carboxypeptidase-like 50 [Corylus avellana]
MGSRSSNLLKLLFFISFLLFLVIFVLYHIAALSPRIEATVAEDPIPRTSSRLSFFFPDDALPAKTGYLSVNQTSSSAIFYALYEAQDPISPLSQTPIVVWLQGGPGCSSMVGNFFEIGPWRVTSRSDSFVLESNPGSWNRIFGLLFLDNPIGTGFSVASTPEEIPRDQFSVASHLFAAITSFIELDPLFKSRPLYFAGESYAGKFVPAIGYHILKANAYLPASKRVNLGGVAIGNGLTDPVNQVSTHAANAYYSGLINERQRNELEKLQREAINLTKMGKWREATNARSHVLSMLQRMTGLATLHDFSKKDHPYETEMVFDFLRKEEVKKALGVKETLVQDVCSDDVAAALHGDFMKSVKFMVEFLVKRSKVLLYEGHLDMRDSVVSTEAWVKTMKWEGLEEFLMAERKVWRVNEGLAGYVQKWGNLSHAVVLGAGHLVPSDQALSSQAMIEDWVLERGSFGYEDIQNELLFTLFD